MDFLGLKNKALFGALSAIIVFLAIFFSIKLTNTAVAQSIELEPGDVSGFAWMGQNITTGGAIPEGGGGWLSLNCKPDLCATGEWGVQIDLSETSNKGKFSGQGWSSNYGWMSFEEDDVDSCWRNNPFVVTQYSAKANIIAGNPEATIRGWAKFIAGDQEDDGWDGCVSFDGIYNRSYIDMNTGLIHGWAWGGDVVGWVSFNNPECPDCNTSVVLSGVPQMTFWVNPQTIPAGGTANIKWNSSNVNGNYIERCEVYGNTPNNYNHWRSTGANTVTNVGEISVSAGNLPAGIHPVPANIVQETTTYSLTCKDKYGVTLPTKYTTLNVTGVCRNPLATNFNGPLPCVFGPGVCSDPSAANTGQPLPCSYYACTDPLANNDVPSGPTVVTDNSLCTYTNTGPTSISLNVDPQIFYDNSTDFDVNLSWTATGPVTSCVGRFIIEDSMPAWDPLAGWTFGVDLPEPNPTVSTWTQQNVAFNSLLSGVVGPMAYTFRITCQDAGGNDVSDTATVNLLHWTPSYEPPQIYLRIQSPNSDPTPTIDLPGWDKEIISASGHPAVVLRWSDLNTESCTAESTMYANNGMTPIGSNADWDGPLPADDDQTDNIMTLDITGAAVLHPTEFRITCVPDDPSLQVPPFPTAWVCLGLAGVPFPACSVTGNGGVGVPTYIEI